jgi:chromosome segregation ATPase
VICSNSERQKEARSGLEREIVQLRNQLADMEKQVLSSRQAADTRATDLITQRTRDIAAVNAQVTDITQQRDRLQVTLNDLTRDHQLALQQVNDQANERYEKLRGDKERLAIECGRLTEAERKRQRHDEEQRQERDRELDAQRNDAERIITGMRNELTTRRNELEEHIAKEKRLNAQIISLQSEVSQSKESIASLTSQLTATTATATKGAESDAAIAALQAQINKQRDHITTLERSSAELERIRTSLSHSHEDAHLIRSLINTFLTSNSLPLPPAAATQQQAAGTHEPVAPSVRHAFSLIQRRLEDVGRLQAEYKKVSDQLSSYQTGKSASDNQKDAQLRQVTGRYDAMVQSFQKMQGECRDALRREDEVIHLYYIVTYTCQHFNHHHESWFAVHSIIVKITSREACSRA